MHRDLPTKQPIYGFFSTTESGVGDISGVMVQGTVGDTGAQFNTGEGPSCLSSRELGATALTVRPETLQPDTETPVTLDAEEAARKKILRSNTNRLNNWYGESFIKGELNSDGSYAGNGARELLAPYMEQLDFAFQLKKIIPNPHQALQTLRANYSYIAAILERHYYEQGEIWLTEPKNPYELAASVGYKLHGPLNLVDEVAAFERDYRGGERFCTYKEIPERLKQYHIMWLRHNDADDTLPANELTADNLSEAWKQYLRIINRYDPETDRYDLIRLAPTREDPYGVSSMSVQISRSGNHVSIKNRYNHTVTNPDNTYSNDLDAVARGLRHALYHHVGRDDLMKLENTKLGDNYTLDNDGGIHYYYYEKDNVYLGHYEYIKNGLVTKIDKGHYDMLSLTLYVSKDGQGKLAGIDHDARSNIKVLADGRHELVLYGDKGSPTHTYHYTYDDKGFIVNLELAVEAAAEANGIFRNPNLTNLTIAEGAKTQGICENPNLTNLTIAEGAKTWSIYDNPNLTNLTIAEGAKTQGICENPNLTNLTIAESAEARDIYDNPNLTNLTIAEGAKAGNIYDNPNLTNLTIAEGAKTGSIDDNPNLTNLTIAEGAEARDIYDNPNLTNLTIAEGAKTGSIDDNPNLTNLTIAAGAKTSSIYNNPNLTNLTIAESAEARDIYYNPNLTNLTIAEGAEAGYIYENPNLTNLTIAAGAEARDIYDNPNLTNLTIAESAEARDIYDNPNLTNLTIAEGAKTGSIYDNPNLTNLTIAEGAIVGRVFVISLIPGDTVS